MRDIQTDHPGPDRGFWGILPLILALALLFLVYPYQVDDASITYRYAAHAARGLGPVFNPHGPVSEGFTSPLWFLLLTLGAWLLGPEALPLLAFVMGSTALLALLGLLWAWGRKKPLGQWFPGLLLTAAWPSLIFYSASGLEMTLFLLALLLSLSLPHTQGPLRKVAWGAIFLLPWIRPEALWLLPVLGGVSVLENLRSIRTEGMAPGAWISRLGRRLREEALTPSLVLLAGQGLLWAVRLSVFGTLLPNTYYAKTPLPIAGLHYLLSFLSQPLTWGLLLAALISGLNSTARERRFLWAGLLWLPAPVLEGGDWMPQHRFFLPATLCLLAAAGGGMVWRFRSSDRFRRALVLTTWLLALALPIAMAREMTDIRLHAQEAFDLLTRRERDIANWVQTQGVRSVGTVDLGVMGFSSQAELVDLAGLTDPRIARVPGGHLRKEFPLDYLFEERRPDVLILRSNRPPRLEGDRLMGCHPASAVENRILMDPRLLRDYRWGFSLEIEGMPKQAKLFFLRRDRTFPPGTVPPTHRVILRRTAPPPPSREQQP